MPKDESFTYPPAVETGIGYAADNDAEVYTAHSCPLCAKYRDPVSGALRPNAETIAAIEEGRAMMRGEIPAKWYNSLEEMLVDLDSDD